jgi:hypothetical protein
MLDEDGWQHSPVFENVEGIGANTWRYCSGKKATAFARRRAGIFSVRADAASLRGPGWPARSTGFYSSAAHARRC